MYSAAILRGVMQVIVETAADEQSLSLCEIARFPEHNEIRFHPGTCAAPGRDRSAPLSLERSGSCHRS